MLIVGVILALVFAFALPRLSKTPGRLVAESALTGIRQAVNDTAIRARATGKPMKLVLDMEASAFLVQPLKTNLPHDWTVPFDLESNSATEVISQNDTYELSSDIEWLPAETGLDQFDEIAYAFFEDGQASGRPLQFQVAGRTYQMDVDKLTGAPLIEELTP